VLTSSDENIEEVKVINVNPREADSKMVTEYNDLWTD